MSSALDMSLDDIIKNKKKSSDRGGFRGGRGGGGGSGRGSGDSGPLRPGGPARRFPNRAGRRATPYSTAKSFQAPVSSWGFNMFADRASGIETGTKLYVSNLDFGVSNEDIKELFSEVGDLKRYSIHYDRSGRSKGTAEVVFSRQPDAVAAVKRYNNVQLDGKPMKIEIVGTNIVTPAVVPRVNNGIFGNPNAAFRRGQGRGGAVGRTRGGRGGAVGRTRGGRGGAVGRTRGGRGGGRSSRGRGHGRGRGRGEPVSVDDLDADLEKYHTEAMQVN